MSSIANDIHAAFAKFVRHADIGPMHNHTFVNLIVQISTNVADLNSVIHFTSPKVSSSRFDTVLMCLKSASWLAKSGSKSTSLPKTLTEKMSLRSVGRR